VVERSRDVIADEPELPGVWRRQEGGYHVRGRTIDPRSGRMREINWALPNVSKARDAFAWLQGELEKIRSGVVAEQPSLAPQFHAYAADVFKRGEAPTDVSFLTPARHGQSGVKACPV
jgi:hypothetical protein